MSLVKGYMGMYLRGKSLSEKISLYKEMCKDHCFFLMDNLNHKCYYVDSNYFAEEMKPLPPEEVIMGSVPGPSADDTILSTKKRKRGRGGREEVGEEEEEEG